MLQTWAASCRNGGGKAVFEILSMVSRIVTPGPIKSDDAGGVSAPVVQSSGEVGRPEKTLEGSLYSLCGVVVFLGVIVVSVGAGRWITALLPKVAGKSGARIYVVAFVAVWVALAVAVFIWRGFSNPHRSGILRIVFIAALVLLGVFVSDSLRATGKGFLDELFFLSDIEDEVSDSVLDSAFLLLAVIVCLPIFLAYTAVHLAYYALFFLGAAAICIVYLIVAGLIGPGRNKATSRT